VGGRLTGLAPAIEEDAVAGTALVQATFPISRRGREVGRAAGVRVTEGSLARSARCFRVLRSGRQVFEGPCTSLKRLKLDVDTVGRNTECGLTLAEGVFTDLQVGDVIQCIQRVSRPRGAAAATSSSSSSAGAASTAGA